MFFRNATFFLFPRMDLFGLGKQLEECRLKPVGPLEMSSRGFVPVHYGSETMNTSAVLNLQRIDWIAVGGEDKILPGSVIGEALHKRIKAMEEQEGRKPGGRTRKRIKDEIITELLPRAFAKPSRTDAVLNSGANFIAIDTPSRKAAESVVSELRRALGSFPALPPAASISPRAVLTGWLAGDAIDTDDSFALGDECVLASPTTGGPTVRIRNMELRSDEVEKHLEAGLQCTHLAITMGDTASFVIGEDLTVRKLKLLDGAIDRLEQQDIEDVAAELEARFYLTADVLAKVFYFLKRAFKIDHPE